MLSVYLAMLQSGHTTVLVVTMCIVIAATRTQAFEAALPKRMRQKAAPALAAVTALLQHTPAGCAAAQQAAAASAAADAAMQELLQV